MNERTAFAVRGKVTGRGILEAFDDSLTLSQFPAHFLQPLAGPLAIAYRFSGAIVSHNQC